MRQLLTERYRERLAGVLSCYDRIIVTGTLPGACYAKGMTGFRSARQIRIFDYPRFAEPLRDRVRERAAELTVALRGRLSPLELAHCFGRSWVLSAGGQIARASSTAAIPVIAINDAAAAPVRKPSAQRSMSRRISGHLIIGYPF